MNRRLARLLLMLYPRPWRERYGTEVVRLTQDLIVTGETTPARGALNMMGAALAERGRALAYSSRTAVAMVVAALLAVAGSLYASGHGRPPQPPSAASAAPVQAKLTRCVVWPEAVGGVVVPAKVKIALPAGAKAPKPVPVTDVLVPVKVIVPDLPGPANVATVPKAARFMCTLAAPGHGRKALMLPSP
jgi:hypothetical protein